MKNHHKFWDFYHINVPIDNAAKKAYIRHKMFTKISLSALFSKSGLDRRNKGHCGDSQVVQIAALNNTKPKHQTTGCVAFFMPAERCAVFIQNLGAVLNSFGKDVYTREETWMHDDNILDDISFHTRTANDVIATVSFVSLFVICM